MASKSRQAPATTEDMGSANTVTSTICLAGGHFPGPSSYNLEIWLTSALLGVTFPFLIIYAEFLKMSPVHRQKEPTLNTAQSTT